MLQVWWHFTSAIFLLQIPMSQLYSLYNRQTQIERQSTKYQAGIAEHYKDHLSFGLESCHNLEKHKKTPWLKVIFSSDSSEDS